MYTLCISLLFFIGRCHNFWGIIFGFLGFVSSRVWFVSFVPTWWDGFTNSIVITVGVISTVQHIIEGMYKAETVLKLCYFNSLIIFYNKVLLYILYIHACQLTGFRLVTPENSTFDPMKVYYEFRYKEVEPSSHPTFEHQFSPHIQ